jgi:hypothetical protein
LNPIIFLAEFTFAVSLILGLGVRLIGVPSAAHVGRYNYSIWTCQLLTSHLPR